MSPSSELIPPRLEAAFRARLGASLAALDLRALPTEGRRHAAVAMALVEEGPGAGVPGLACSAPPWSEAPALLLTRRSAKLRAHAGQWAWPGGRIDAGETPEDAARRELREEVGLDLDATAVLGRLDDYATRSGYVITPVLLWAPQARQLTANAQEVASIHRLPLAELLREDAPLLNRVKGSEHPVLRMPVGERWIAAPTAAFLYQFREVCLLGRPTRVAHFDQPFFAWR
ncbi:MAG: CoA pyrophosphatase [Rubrivivax sp.]|nr:CoA pyrophosphatase [Rubrivivax sp.]